MELSILGLNLTAIEVLDLEHFPEAKQLLVRGAFLGFGGRSCGGERGEQRQDGD
jgi:hypothetical protein